MSAQAKIAVIGGGISGLSCAHYLSKKYQVTLFEANDYVGGHTDTHVLKFDDETVKVDSGFIVFNDPNYPNFNRLLNELGIEGQDSNMSFSVSNQKSGLEYNATDLNSLFCQRKNLFSPRFYRMLRDLIRFYKESPKVLETSASEDQEQTLYDYLKQNRYGEAFIEDHIIPMACALWSGPRSSILSFPVRYFVSFMNNHKMLDISQRPQWRVVKNGSRSYVNAVLKQNTFQYKINAPVQSIQRKGQVVNVVVNGEQHQFDKVFIATHSDTALSMLDDPSDLEHEVLSGIEYQENTMCLHSDTSILPSCRKAWASWNARIDQSSEQRCTVSYYMNLLQNLESKRDFIVTLNCDDQLDPEKIWVKRNYAHPIYNQSTIASQARWHELAQELNNTYFCGAYWGWGFHEDGISSAVRAIQYFDQEMVEHSGDLNEIWKHVA